ncbi:unnamed protein product [Tilletia laevis]|uniref:Uncharacterized protein n=2 Tax=Tilletia TaxID=13289 RepID=A0A8T8SG28_9BASI|nr:hypothetical protein CF335_g8046 [Tilletia laevis]KAE8239111.1 hypothetical protein A4X03_0g8703 [Tilletia caries]CAD6978940.1 unnamed protein product [Tilletia controversa]CAD6906006.1 unnamed protein product [Tilletia caries]CAD6935447.1 unnamed protein product [Tilletia laevis]
MTAANVISGFANTGMRPFTGLAAIPPANFIEDKKTDEVLEELVDETNCADECVDTLWALGPAAHAQSKGVAPAGGKRDGTPAVSRGHV